MSNYHICGDDIYIIILYCDVAFAYRYDCMLGDFYISYISCIKINIIVVDFDCDVDDHDDVDDNDIAKYKMIICNDDYSIWY